MANGCRSRHRTPAPKRGGPAQVQYQLQNRDTVQFFECEGWWLGIKQNQLSVPTRCIMRDFIFGPSSRFVLFPLPLLRIRAAFRFTGALPPFASNIKNIASKCRNLQRVQYRVPVLCRSCLHAGMEGHFHPCSCCPNVHRTGFQQVQRHSRYFSCVHPVSNGISTLPHPLSLQSAGYGLSLK